MAGMSNGEVRCYSFTQFEAKLDWTIKAALGSSKSEPIFVRAFRLSQGQNNDVIVARSDSTLDIFSQRPTKDSTNISWERIANIDISEAITGIEGAVFNDRPMLIVSTFSGNLMGMTLRNEYTGVQEAQMIQVAPLVPNVDLKKTIEALQADIQALES